MAELLRLNEQAGTNKFGDAIIGTLEGPCADLLEGTRNGRLYTKALWEKVFSSEKFTEYMKNGGVIGELDHPETRVETLLKEAAIKMSEKPYMKDGVMVARFDILNTPNGQIAKALAKAGISLGISSRGNGETYIREGKEVVNENTYDFEAFDLVYLPAVKSARMKMVESVQTGLKENLMRLVESAPASDKQTLIGTINRLDIPELLPVKESLSLKDIPEVNKRISKDLASKYNVPEDDVLEIAKDGIIETIEKEYQESLNKMRKMLTPEQFEKAKEMLFNVKTKAQFQVRNGLAPEFKLENKHTAAESDGAMLKDLQEAIQARIKLEDENVALLEKVSAGSAREAKLKEEIGKLQATVRGLSEKSQKVDASAALVESLKQEKEKLLKESKVNSEKLEARSNVLVEKIKAEKVESENLLKEQLTNLKRKIVMVESKKDIYKEQLDELLTQKEALSKERLQLKESLTKALDNQKAEAQKTIKLEETYKKDATIKVNLANTKLEESIKANKTLNERLSNISEGYIQSICRTKGFNVNEFKSKLPKDFTTRDITLIAESMQNFKLRANTLPFETSSKMGVRINGGSEPILERMKISNPDADISDSLLDSIYGNK